MTAWRKTVIVALTLEGVGAACLVAPFAAGDFGPCGPSSVPLSFAFLIGTVMHCVGIGAATVLGLEGAAYYVVLVLVQTAAWILFLLGVRWLSAIVNTVDQKDI